MYKILVKLANWFAVKTNSRTTPLDTLADYFNPQKYKL